MNHSEFYRLFSAYWWLIFPVGWGAAMVLRLWMRHLRAQKALEVIQSYVDRDKEPPAELLNLVERPERSVRSLPPGRAMLVAARGMLIGGFLFAALALGFSALMFGRLGGNDRDNVVGLLFVTILMAGLAAGFFVAARLVARDSLRLEGPAEPPQAP